MNRRVVVTGAGLVTPLGIGVDETWQGLTAGRSGIDLISRFDTSDYTVKIAAEVKGFDAEVYIEKKVAKHLELFVQYAVSSAIMARDDSGLEIYALGGAPGTLSARYSGEGANDSSNIEKLLNEMKDFPEGERRGRFVCCIALASPDGRTMTFFGYAEGTIGHTPKGSYGFGYDPVFYPEGFIRTFAEMSAKEKDALSHRGKALEKLKKHLNSIC